MAIHYLRKLVNIIYHKFIENDIGSGRFRIIELPQHKIPKCMLDKVIKAYREAKTYTTFTSSPKTGFVHLIRPDYVNEVIKALENMGIKTDKDDVLRALGAKEYIKRFGSRGEYKFVLYVAQPPEYIMRKALDAVAEVVP